MGKFFKTIKEWRPTELSVGKLFPLGLGRVFSAGKARTVLAILAALVGGSAIGGLAMVLLAGDGSKGLASIEYFGDLERNPEIAQLLVNAQQNSPNEEDNEAPFARVDAKSDPENLLANLAEPLSELALNEQLAEGSGSNTDPSSADLPGKTNDQIAEADTTIAATAIGSASDGATAPRQRFFGLDEQGPLPPGLQSLPTSAPKANADPELLKPGISGSLPAIAADGRTALDVYARDAVETAIPKISIIVMDLGLNPKLSADSVQLPAEIALGFSPYMANGEAWHRYARGNGHETVITLPVSHDPSVGIDEGPLAIDPTYDDDELKVGLNRVLVRGQGYIAAISRTGRFAKSPDRFGAVAQALAEHGVGFVELGDAVITASPPAQNLAHAHARIDLDRLLTPQGIENQLQLLERLAQTEGHAIGYTKPYPIVFDRIWQWANALDQNRIALVPLSSLLKS